MRPIQSIVHAHAQGSLEISSILIFGLSACGADECVSEWMKSVCVLRAVSPGSQCDDSLSITFTFTLFLACVMCPPTTHRSTRWRLVDSWFDCVCACERADNATYWIFHNRTEKMLICIGSLTKFVWFLFFGVILSSICNDKLTIHNYTIAISWHIHFAGIARTDAFRNDFGMECNFRRLTARRLVGRSVCARARESVHAMYDYVCASKVSIESVFTSRRVFSILFVFSVLWASLVWC